jgi:hypothetical protein
MLMSVSEKPVHTQLFAVWERTGHCKLALCTCCGLSKEGGDHFMRRRIVEE